MANYKVNFMKSNNFLQLIILIASLLFSFSAFSAPLGNKEAEIWAEEKGQLLLTTFKNPDIAERYAKLDELFLEYVDMDYVAKFVIGKYWKNMAPEQKKLYLQLFRRYALAMYKTFPLDFAESITYKIAGASSDAKFTNVTVKVNVKLSPDKAFEDIMLRFKLYREGDKVRLADIMVAESSLMLAYRTKFYEMIAGNDGEIEWFLEDLEGLASSAETINNKKLAING